MSGKSEAKQIKKANTKDMAKDQQSLLAAAQAAASRGDYETAARAYAQFAARLEEKVDQQTADLEHRDHELAILNSVQEGLASDLDLFAIFEIVGQKLGQIYPDDDIALGTYDAATDWMTPHFILDEVVVPEEEKSSNA